MPEKTSLHIPLDAASLNLLACPACQGVLSIDAQQLVCTGCRRAYPIVDGIPVLIAERAKIPSIDEA